MNASSSNTPNYLQPQDVFTSQELSALSQRIQTSGELGRSKVYASLLDYLIACSLTGKSPKEIEIAIDVLGKGSDYDASRDSGVRVYIHQLRKKLDNYYEANESEARYRIVIPKGQYAVAAVSNAPTTAAFSIFSTLFQKPKLTNALLLTLVFLLAANLILILNRSAAPSLPLNAGFAGSNIWGGLLDDDLPILLVMGDYYIFGELNGNGNIGRMVREFNINSPEDLEARHFSDWERTHNYQDLNLSYMPEGSAFALTQIIPILSSTGKRLKITMMSDLTTADLRGNHIVYVGYISALAKLTDRVFAPSNLQIGRSYDELLDVETGQYYTSDAGLPEQGQQFRDYGFFSTFPAGNENQIVIVSGMRDAGLMHTAQVLANANSLTALEQMRGSAGQGKEMGLEALYQVFGMDRMDFEGNLVYSNNFDASQFWEQQISEPGN